MVTTGAKTGQRREHQLTYFHDGRDPILTASNYGGDKHPQWYYNLKANPQCEFGDEPFIATEVTDPDEYTRLYGLAEKVYAGWSDYLAKTAAVGRTIPVFRLGCALTLYSRAKQGLASSLGIDASWLENLPTTPLSVTSTLSAWIPSG